LKGITIIRQAACPNKARHAALFQILAQAIMNAPLLYYSFCYMIIIIIIATEL
jgi:hypothetical protein